jgi:acyl carrier protein
MYKTGDLCRYLPDSTIEYLGRMDHQVKIRGFRIEPGEIEAVLGRHASIKQCVVIAREDKAGDRRLVAYIEPASAAAPTVEDLRTSLGKVLPDYMIPAAFVVLDRLPLTASGKLDRMALPAPSEDRPLLQSTFVAPRTPTEETLAQIFCDLLSVSTVGAHDDFFRLGGHSLLATRLVSRVRDEIGVEFMLRDVFGGPNIEHLAKLVESRRTATTPSASITPRSRRRALVATSTD